MKLKTDIVIVGSGAGGATLAKELAGHGKRVLVLERGRNPKPQDIGTLRSAVLDFYDKCALRTSKEGLIIYRALMTGGTTVVSCGTGVRILEEELRQLGVDLTEEFDDTEKELRISRLPDRLIGKGSKLIVNSANRLGLEMEPMLKFINPDRCNSCGQCVLGCRTGAKWSAIDFVKKARARGAKLINRMDVRSVVIRNDKVVGLVAKGPKGNVRVFARVVILAAGGIGSPVILKRSGFDRAGRKLFADIFNVTYGILKDKNVNLWREPAMAVVSMKFMKEKGFLISPFIDVPLVLRWVMSKRKQAKGFKYADLLGIMAKTKDDDVGRVTKDERFEKSPTSNDMKRLNEGARISAEILRESGVKKKDIIFTKPRAAHPGGSAAIGDVVDRDLRTKVDGLYVCDASVLPESAGAPPIVTIISLAKRLAKHLRENDFR